jgi:hypothetical protein
MTREERGKEPAKRGRRDRRERDRTMSITIDGERLDFRLRAVSDEEGSAN